MAVSGRQKTKWNLLSQAVSPASPTARSASAKSRALSPMSGTCKPTMSLSAWFHTTRKLELQNKARSVCSGVRALLEWAPRALTSLYAVAYRLLVRDGGVGARNCEGLVKVKGVTLASHGASIGEKDGGGPGRYEGVGRHSPRAVPPVKGGGFNGKLPSFARKAMIPAAACWPTDTPGSSSAKPWVAR